MIRALRAEFSAALFHNSSQGSIQRPFLSSETIPCMCSCSKPLKFLNLKKRGTPIFTSSYQPQCSISTTTPPPFVLPISSRTLTNLLPLSGTGDQVLVHLGGPPTWLRRAVISLVGAAVLYNVNMFLTVVAALYWAWTPMLSAGKSNIELRLKYRYGGLWRARVLDTEMVLSSSGKSRERKLRITIGDESKTEVEMLVDPSSVSAPVRRGDSVEFLVLSDRPDLSRFRVLREAFLPHKGLWLAEKLHVERSIFEEMSAEFALMLVDDQEESDDWETECAIAANDHAQDVENYQLYNDEKPNQLQLGDAKGISSSWTGSGLDFGGDGELVGFGNDMPSWTMADNVESDFIPESLRGYK